MNAYTHVAQGQQEVLDEPYLLSVDEILPTESGNPAADDLILANAFWNRRRDTLIENMTRNAIFEAWRSGSVGSVEAFNALLAYQVMDVDIVVGLYADYSAAVASGEAA